MDETILSWNFTNWVTVVLMVVIGFALVRIISTSVSGGGA